MKYVGYALIAVGTLLACGLLFLVAFRVLDLVIMTPYIQMGIAALVAGFFIVVIDIGFGDKGKR